MRDFRKTSAEAPQTLLRESFGRRRTSAGTSAVIYVLRRLRRLCFRTSGSQTSAEAPQTWLQSVAVLLCTARQRPGRTHSLAAK